MKDLHLLIWVTQLGISVVAPPVGCVLLAVWLRSSFGWGSWVIWAGAALGGILAIDGLRSSLKLMHRASRNKKDPQPPPVSFNDHD